MIVRPNIYGILPFLVSIMLNGLALLILRRRSKVAERSYFWLLFTIALWLFGFASQLTGLTENTVMLGVRLRLLGELVVPATWLTFTLYHTGVVRRVDYRVLVLFALPLVLAATVMTNPLHHAFLRDYTIDVTSAPYAIFSPQFGPLFAIHITYGFLLSFIAIWLLLKSLRRSRGIQRNQSILILVAWLLVLLAALADASGFPAIPAGIQSVHYMMCLAGLILAWALYYYRLFDIVPVARDQVIKGMVDGVVVLDADNRVFDFNPAAEEITGLKARDVIGRLGEEVLAGLPEAAVPYVGTQRANAEIPYMRDGQLVTLELRISPLLDQKGAHSGRVVILRDVTERNQAEDVLRNALIRTNTLYRASMSLVAFDNLSMLLRNVVYGVAEALSAYQVMLVGLDMESQEITHFVTGGPGAADGFVVDYHQLMDGLTGYVMGTLEPVLSSGERPDPREGAEARRVRHEAGHGSTIVVPMRYRDKTFGTLTAINRAEQRDFSFQDVDLMMALGSQAAAAISNAQLLETVQRYAAELEVRNQELDAYSHTVAHDLKRPLTYIVGYLDLIAEDERIPQDIAENLTRLMKASNRMNEIIEGLLHLAQLRHAKEIITVVEMRKVVDSVLDRLNADITARAIHMQVDEVLPDVMGHAQWLEEVLTNLVGNAIKYIGRDNAAPCIAIAATRHGQAVRYAVTDNGVGIAPEHQEHVFDIFSRYHRAEAEGSGLGLSIVSRIISKLGGEVGVESVQGEGSTFWFTLPAVEED